MKHHEGGITLIQILVLTGPPAIIVIADAIRAMRKGKR